MAWRPRRTRRSRNSGARMLGALLVLAVLLLGAWLEHWHRRWQPNPAPPAAMSGGGTVRIATWNLRKFSERAAPDLVSIAKIIMENGFHLLAIQEVQREGQVVERLRRQLGEPWRHVVSGRTGNNERYAFLYRADVVEPVSEPALMSGPDMAVFDRVPFFGAFRSGQFDFALVTVHLSYSDTARRAREAEALARISAHLAASGAEKDVIVLGDFNEQGKGNLYHFDTLGWQRLNHEATNIAVREYVYDNILIDPRFTREYTGRVGVVRFDDALAGDIRRAADDISDHRPVYAEFAATADDD